VLVLLLIEVWQIGVAAIITTEDELVRSEEDASARMDKSLS
jgi:hypothetical protein